MSKAADDHPLNQNAAATCLVPEPREAAVPARVYLVVWREPSIQSDHKAAARGGYDLPGHDGLILVKFQDACDLHQQHTKAPEVALRDPNDRGDPPPRP